MNNEHLPVSCTQALPCSQYTVEHPGSVHTKAASDWSFVNRELWVLNYTSFSRSSMGYQQFHFCKASCRKLDSF